MASNGDARRPVRLDGPEAASSPAKSVDASPGGLDALRRGLAPVPPAAGRGQERSARDADLLDLLETVEVPIVMLDAAGRVRRFTPSAGALLHLTPARVGSALGGVALELHAPDLESWIAQATRTGAMVEAEVQDRAERWHRLQIRPHRAPGGRVDGTILSLVDIHALKQELAEARHANDAKDQFLAALSHELRTPLTSLFLQVELLRAGAFDAAKAQRVSAVIERSARLQLRLVEELLDISRIVAGKLHLQEQWVDLASVVRAAIEFVKAPAEDKSLHVAADLAAPIPPVRGDPARLQQVVANLLTNSIRLTPEGGRLGVKLDLLGGSARVAVTDTGGGIGPEFLPHVFDRFAQEEGTHTRGHGGLGLGLAIVRHIVELHGGTIQAESPGRGLGATFTVLLPLQGAGESTTNSEPERDAAHREPPDDREGSLR